MPVPQKMVLLYFFRFQVSQFVFECSHLAFLSAHFDMDSVKVGVEPYSRLKKKKQQAVQCNFGIEKQQGFTFSQAKSVNGSIF